MSQSAPAAPAPGAFDTGMMPEGWLLPFRQKMLVLSGVLASFFAFGLSQNVLSTAMPRIVGDLGGLDLFAWPFTAFMLASTAIVPLAGKLSDIYGRKWFLVIGNVIFLLGSLLCGFSESMLALILFRVVQGIGGGLIMATGFTAIGDLFAPSERGRWTGVMAATFASSSIIGPLLGGYLTDHLSWRWTFFINVPLGVAATAVVVWGMPWVRARAHARIDYLGGMLLIGASAPLLLAFSWAGNQYPWGDPRVIGAFATAGVATLLFLVVEARVGDRGVLPLNLFRQGAFRVSMVALLVIGLGLFSVIQFMPLFIQGAQGASATNSGIVLAPQMLGFVVGSIVMGQLASRLGHYRELGVAGISLLYTGLFLISRLDAESSLWLTRGFMVVIGLGMGMTMPLFTLTVQNALPYSLLGVGTAAVQFFRQLGGTMGVAVFGSLLATRFASRLDTVLGDGFSTLKDAPQLLLDPARTEQFRQSVETADPGTSLAVISLARSALGGVVTDLFFLASFAVLAALLIVFFLPKIHVRPRDEMMAEMQNAMAMRAGAAPPIPAAPPLAAATVAALPAPLGATRLPAPVARSTLSPPPRRGLSAAIGIGVAVGLVASSSTRLRAHGNGQHPPPPGAVTRLRRSLSRRVEPVPRPAPRPLSRWQRLRGASARMQRAERAPIRLSREIRTLRQDLGRWIAGETPSPPKGRRRGRR